MNMLRPVFSFVFMARCGAACALLTKTRPEVAGNLRLDHLPDDFTELQTLCTDVGLQKACQALSTSQSDGYSKFNDVAPEKLSILGRRAFRGIPSFSQTSRTAENRTGAELTKRIWPLSTEQCLTPGKLIFQHVMKTGGLALERFFRCTCEERPSGLCSIRIKANHWAHTTQPEGYASECIPSICSTHSAPTDTDEACGAEFANASRFTTIRDPVSRVWSFYNYLRRWYKPYIQYTLKDILQNYHNVDLNIGLQESEQCFHCHQQLSNAMAAHHYAGVGAADEVLARMSAIIDLGRLGDFPEISKKFALFPEHLSLSGSTECTVEHIEPTNYSLGTHPDPETAELIAQHNAEDITLYEYVQALPQYVS